MNVRQFNWEDRTVTISWNALEMTFLERHGPNAHHPQGGEGDYSAEELQEIYNTWCSVLENGSYQSNANAKDMLSFISGNLASTISKMGGSRPSRHTNIASEIQQLEDDSPFSR